VYNAQSVFQQFALNTPDTAAFGSGSVTGITRGGNSFSSEYLNLDYADSASWSSLSTAGWGALFAESQDNPVTSYTSFQNALGIYSAAGGLFGDYQQSISSAVYIDTGYLVVVPEPSTYMLLGVASLVLFYAVRRRKV
jgi:hypothetical protein